MDLRVAPGRSARTCPTTWPASVESDLRNVRRTGVLKNRLRTSITVPTGQPHVLTAPKTPPSIEARTLRRAPALRRLAADLGDLGDRRQRLAAKAEACGSETDRRPRRACWWRAAGTPGPGRRASIPRPLSATRTRSLPPRSTRQVDARRLGVDRVLEQLLDHARRPLDDLARGDLIDDRRR